jgi:LuxR family maltose regulon positive regulatory protein
VTEALTASLDGGRDALEAALRAEEALPLVDPAVLRAHPELRGLVAGSKARALVRLGELDAAVVALEDGLRDPADRDADGLASELVGAAALLDALGGRLRRARERCGRWPAPVDEVATGTLPAAAALALGWVAEARGDLAGARRMLAAARGAAPSYDALVHGAVLAVLQSRLLVAEQQCTLARAGLRAARSACTPPGSWLHGLLVEEEAAAWLAEGVPDEAIALLGSSVRPRQRRDLLLVRAGAGADRPAVVAPAVAALQRAPLDAQVTEWLVRAERALVDGEAATAERCLDRALALAGPERLRRPFHDLSDEVRALLAGAVLRRRSAWLEAGEDRGEDRAEDGAGTENPLTGKEREVLGYLAELLTTDEMAAEMFVSVNTVRSHVRSILSKLGVGRRNEAVRRAWELGLLPSRPAA